MLSPCKTTPLPRRAVEASLVQGDLPPLRVTFGQTPLGAREEASWIFGVKWGSQIEEQQVQRPQACWGLRESKERERGRHS